MRPTGVSICVRAMSLAFARLAGVISHDEGKADLSFQNLSRFCTDERRLHRLGHFAGPDSVACGRRLIHLDAHRRDIGLLLDRQVDHARHSGITAINPLRQRAQIGKIVAENLHCDVGASAREHVIDAVRDRLTDGHVHAGQQCYLLANLLAALLPWDGPSFEGPHQVRRTRLPARVRRAPLGRFVRAVEMTSGTVWRIRSNAAPS